MQSRPPKPIVQSSHIVRALQKEVDKLLRYDAIRPCLDRHPDQYLSNIFGIPKDRADPESKVRLILNLKSFNKFITTPHFQIPGLTTIAQAVIPGCYIAKADITAAYNHIRVDPASRHWLRFKGPDQLIYEYTSVPFGMSTAPSIFVSIMKPPLSHLREKLRIRIYAYMDDLYIMNLNPDSLVQNYIQTLRFFSSLGWEFNVDKCDGRGRQCQEVLGFLVNSVTMTIKPTREKIASFKTTLKKLLRMKRPQIRFVSKCLGKICSMFPACALGRTRYRQIELDKVEALRRNHFNFNCHMSLSKGAKKEIVWWIDHADGLEAPIFISPPTIEVFTDSCQTAWGASVPSLQLSTQGFFSPTEFRESINTKETLAALKAAQAFAEVLQHHHILFLTDSITALSYLRNMGGLRSQARNSAAKDFWFFLTKTLHSWASFTFVPGRLNRWADEASRDFSPTSIAGEYTLTEEAFDIIVDAFGEPTWDLFASPENAKCELFISRFPAPRASLVDAFAYNWCQFPGVYIFCPFRLMSRVVQRLTQQPVQAIIVFPRWPTQSWWSQLQDLIHGTSLSLPPNCIHLPWTPRQTPFEERLQLNVGMCTIPSSYEREASPP